MCLGGIGNINHTICSLSCVGVDENLVEKPKNVAVSSGESKNLDCGSDNNNTKINWRYSNIVIVQNCLVQYVVVRTK